MKLALLIIAISIAISAQTATVPPPANPGLATAAHKALAVISGKLRVPGLDHPVNVLRDRWGVAHIYAENQHDLFFAQGIVAAQDRLFQMELWKRAGQGRLAEILGPSALPRDINARALRYRGDMQLEYESYAPDTKAILTAFTDGINSYIASLAAPGGLGLPIEFQLAGFSPDPWHPEDCLNRMAAFSMTGNAFSELEHAQALTDLGPEKAALFFNFDPAVALDPAPHLDLTGLTPDLLKNLIGSDHRIEFPARPLQESNNWTISGALTATGKPLLANDPHRVIGLPSLRYMIHLVAPGWNVIGAGEPGLPGVALGHNDHIAWGFTIFGLDQQDLYVEELNPSNPLEYKTENGWAKMELKHETFLVRGTAPSEIDLKFTRHGPILWSDGKRALALRWVGSEPGTAGYLASLSIDRAENWDQFESAVARWKVPSENLVYADSDGNIGEHSAGLAPIRNWTGLLPVPGNGDYNWTGFVPTAELPHFFNPKEGFVATANNKTIPDNYPYKVGFEWAPAYRVTRIRSVIESAKHTNHKLTLSDIEALQTDIASLPALEFQKLLLSTPLKTDPTLALFFHWDGRLTRQVRRRGSLRSLVPPNLHRTRDTIFINAQRTLHRPHARHRSSPSIESRQTSLRRELPSRIATNFFWTRFTPPAISFRNYWAPTPHNGLGANFTPSTSVTRSISNLGPTRYSTSVHSRAPAMNTRSTQPEPRGIPGNKFPAQVTAKFSTPATGISPSPLIRPARADNHSARTTQT